MFNTPLIKSDDERDSNIESYEEAGYRDDTHLDEVKEAEESYVEAWVKLGKVPSKFQVIIYSLILT